MVGNQQNSEREPELSQTDNDKGTVSGGSQIGLKVWGEWACFTRPEMKVERVSYPVITPSAARGVLEAIFWKPEMQWRVREIWVLNPIRHFSILRNEVDSKAAFSSAATGMDFYAEENRSHRHTLALKDVAYVIRADIELRPGVRYPVRKYREMFQRRAAQGQYFHHPFLGMREFPANFALADGSERAVEINDDFGLMLFDLAYGQELDQPRKSGRGTPVFFHARLENGVLRLPPGLYTEVAHAAQRAR